MGGPKIKKAGRQKTLDATKFIHINATHDTFIFEIEIYIQRYIQINARKKYS